MNRSGDPVWTESLSEPASPLFAYAIERFVGTFYDFLKRIAMRVLPEEEAHDAVTAYILWVNRNGLPPYFRGGLKPYVVSSFCNNQLYWAKSRHFARAADRPSQLSLESVTSEDSSSREIADYRERSSIDNAAQNERVDALQDAITTLPANCKYVIRRYYFDADNPSREDIGNELGITKDAVRHLEYRALRILSERLL